MEFFVLCDLGMPVCEALAYVEQHKSLFDVVHVKYNDEVSIIAMGDFCLESTDFEHLAKLGFWKKMLDR